MGKKILEFSLVPRARQVKFLLVLLSINLSEIYCQLTCTEFFACPPDIGWKYMLVLPEI